MTGRPGDRTMEMNGGSTVSYLARTLCVAVSLVYFNRSGSKGLLDFQGRHGIISIVRWKPSPGRIRCRVNSPASILPYISGVDP